MKKSSYAGMSIDALLDAKRAIEEMLTERAGQLRKQLASLTGTRGPKARKGTSLKGKKLPPKYRGPKGETWAGRGAQPLWLRDLLKKGRKLESFSVDRKAKPAPAKKATKAKKAKPAAKRKSAKRAKANGAATRTQTEAQSAASGTTE